MPWLSRLNSAEDDIKPIDKVLEGSGTCKSGSMVKFIPAQIDGLCGTLPAHHRRTASQLLLEDIRVLIQNLGYLPTMVKATFSRKILRSLFMNLVDARDALLQACLAILQLWIFLFAVPAFVSLPGLFFVGFLNASWLLTLSMTWPLCGPRVWVQGGEKAPMTDNFSDERWIYVNGMMCSIHSFRTQCNRLSRIFGRPITGIHNRTSGLVLDILMLLVQRCFSVPTPCTLTLGSQIRDACLTNSVHKVVIIGHSTGAIHISIALDQLHASLPVDVLSKLEIYTFGSGAAHLSNPCLSVDNLGLGSFSYTRPDGSIASPVKATLASLGHRVEDHERVIPHIEHYALESDIIARCGILHNTRSVLDNRFCGRVFILNENNPARPTNGSVSRTSGGFMLNEHYLDLLFSSDSQHASSVLDQVVEVDMGTAEKREFTAQGVALPQKSVGRYISDNGSRTQPDSPSDISPKTKNRTSWETSISTSGVGKARIAARECEGKTVRQLSRLWRYLHGGRPVGEGVALVNGVRNGLSANGLGMVQ